MPPYWTAVDVFRGIAVAAMIAVNNPGNWGAVYPPLVHAYWNGLTAADLIFPAFVFVAGVTAPLALGRRAERSGRTAALVHVGTRAAALIACGLLINIIAVAPQLGEVRVPGVLQRIGLAFAFAAPLVVVTGARVWVGAMVMLLVGHSLLLYRIPFAGHPAGTLTPAANLPGAVDAALFGPSHLQTPTLDPEGIVGTLTTAATLLCGAVAGRWLQRASTPARRAAGLIGGGMALAAAGIVWGRFLPLNKSLWTGSFVLVTAGVAAIALGCLLVVRPSDRASERASERRSWSTPFVWLGVNPLAIYMLSEVARHLGDRPLWRTATGSDGIKDLVFWRVIAPVMGDGGGPRSSLVFALGVTAAWVAIAGLFHRRGLRFRV